MISRQENTPAQKRDLVMGKLNGLKNEILEPPPITSVQVVRPFFYFYGFPNYTFCRIFDVGYDFKTIEIYGV